MKRIAIAVSMFAFVGYLALESLDSRALCGMIWLISLVIYLACCDEAP